MALPVVVLPLFARLILTGMVLIAGALSAGLAVARNQSDNDNVSPKEDAAHKENGIFLD